MRPRRKRFTIGSLFSRPASIVAIGLFAFAVTVLFWFMFLQAGLPVLLWELGARSDVEPGRIDSTSVTHSTRAPDSFYVTITYGTTTTEVTTNRTPVFTKLSPGEQVKVKLISGRPVEIDSPDGNLQVDDALAWDLGVPGVALVGVLLIALGFQFRRDVGGWWPQIDGKYVDPLRFGPAIRLGIAVAGGLVVAGLAIGFWNGMTGSSPAPIVAPLLAVVAVGGAIVWMQRTVRWLEGGAR